MTKKSTLTSALSPLTPLKNNPDFTLVTVNINLHTRNPTWQITVRDCFHNGQIKDTLTLQSNTGLLSLPLWSYFQIRSFVNDKTKKPFLPESWLSWKWYVLKETTLKRQRPSPMPGCNAPQPRLRIVFRGNGQGLCRWKSQTIRGKQLVSSLTSAPLALEHKRQHTSSWHNVTPPLSN